MSNKKPYYKKKKHIPDATKGNQSEKKEKVIDVKEDEETISQKTEEINSEKITEEKTEETSEVKEEVKQDDTPEKENVEIIEEKNSKELEYLMMAQQIQAEFDNYRKRMQEAEKNAMQKGIIKAVEKILPVIDSFDHAEKQNTNDEFLEATKIIRNMLDKALTDLGVTKIDAKGKKFDHNFHNAIMVQKVEGVEPNIVLDVFQEGYMLNDKVIRYSIVKVSE